MRPSNGGQAIPTARVYVPERTEWRSPNSWSRAAPPERYRSPSGLPVGRTQRVGILALMSDAHQAIEEDVVVLDVDDKAWLDDQLRVYEELLAYLREH